MRRDVARWKMLLSLPKSPALVHIPGQESSRALGIDVPAQSPFDES